MKSELKATQPIMIHGKDNERWQQLIDNEDDEEESGVAQNIGGVKL